MTAGIRRGLAAAVLLLAPQPAAAGEAPRHVGSAACTACHAAAAAAWAGSHHARAWTEATPQNVAGDFDGTAFSHGGMTARFRIGEDGGYHVAVTETDGATADYRIHSVAGVEPLQQYLIETAPGRLQSFDVVWDTGARRWFHLYPDQELPPDDGLHWTGPYKTWNARCAECHATGFAKNYDHRSRSYASTQAEIGVGCEACHGPGSAHLDWAAGRPPAPAGGRVDARGLTMSFDATEATVQQCATCHARREAHGQGNPVPGTPFHDSYALALLRPGLYHADGQILDEVYVYGSFLQSRMYAAGVGCLACHDAHGAGLVAEGNAVCTQCHSPAGNPGFPTLARTAYDTPAHHFHPPGSTGAACTACHAPERVYMGNDWRADHSFRVPRPDLAAATGAPDACTGCHAGRDPGWAAAEIAARFPDSRHRGPHYGEVIARGRADPAAAAEALADLAADLSSPGIVRATALRLLEDAASAEAAERLAPLLADPDPLVRAAAAGLQRSAPPQERVLRLLEALDDPVRSVRIAAARAFLGAPVARLPAAMQADLDRAMAEWRAALATRLDFPETHLQLGGLALAMRATAPAASAFREVVGMDPQRTEAWVMLVRLAALGGGADAARAVLAEALAAAPGDPALLALARQLGAD